MVYEWVTQPDSHAQDFLLQNTFWVRQKVLYMCGCVTSAVRELEEERKQKGAAERHPRREHGRTCSTSDSE